MQTSTAIKKISVSDLIPYANNSRTHSDEQVLQIASSIKEFGFINPVIVDGENGIIAGHGRVMAAKKLGLMDVPCVDASHLSEAQKKAYIIADNKLALNAGWDDDILRIELDMLTELDFDLSLTGFSDEELQAICQVEEIAPEYEDDADGEIIEPPPEPKTKEGDVWVLGKHRLMCGDSTSIDAVEGLMDGCKADLWITDPPYNVAYEGKTEDALTIQNDSMSDSDFRQFLTDCYSAADANMKEGASFYIWYADIEAYNFVGGCIDIGWKVRQNLIWVKNQLVMGRKDYHFKHEPCLYGWKDGAAHNWYSDRKQTTVLEFNKPQRNGEHPTMKPVDLFEYQIQNSTKQGQNVLDSFGGSGTTMVACEKTNRKAYLMELDPKYCDVIINRWQTLTGKEAVLESTGETYNDTAA